jgi:anti-sigma-K factor RskA
MREEPRVAQRVEQFRREFAVSPRPLPGLAPSAAELDRGWARLERELDLAPAAAPWWRGVTFWRGWALAATVVAAVAVWRAAPGPVEAPPIALRPVAELVDAGKQPLIAAALSADARVLELRPVRPIVAGPAQSYELWVIPVEGGAPRWIATRTCFWATRKVLRASAWLPRFVARPWKKP